MRILAYLLVGVSIGGISGLLGIGGGVLMVPVLMWFFGLEQRQAQGITLAVLSIPVVLPAVWSYYDQKQITGADLAVAGWIAAAFAVGTFAGAALQRVIPAGTLSVLFGLMLMYVATRFLVRSDSTTANAAAGLTAVGVAWVAYVGLRLLGRRHLPPPPLGEQIRAMHEQGRGEIDYHI
jgi:uncharacterized membrane protein YfcA